MSHLRLAVLLGAVGGVSCLAVPLSSQARDLPASARPGECYGKATTPAVYRTLQRQVLVHPARTETRPIAAVTERVAHRVLVRPEVVERHHTPAAYRTVVAWVEHPGKARQVVEAARYETVSEKVQVEAGHAEWRRSDAPLAYGETASGQTLVQGTGEIVCRIWIPARFQITQRRVLVSPGRSYEVVGPSRREKIVRRELVSPGGWTEHRKAAVYRTEWVSRVVHPASSQVVTHPAVYRTVQSQVLVRPGHAVWSRIPCHHAHKVVQSAPPAHVCGYCTLSAGPGPAYVARIQRALIGQGYDPGVPDGEAKPQTYRALRQFQNQRGLPQTGMSLETARALGVE